MKITTSYSMIKPILRLLLLFFFIMECAVIAILNMVLLLNIAILLLYDFVGIY